VERDQHLGSQHQGEAKALDSGSAMHSIGSISLLKALLVYDMAHRDGKGPLL